jgi:hypothetical protein
MPPFDLGLDADGDLRMPAAFITGRDALIQAARIRLSTQIGSWPLDTALGLPFREWLEAVAPPIASIQSNAQRELAGLAGVRAVRDVTVAFNEDTGVIDLGASLELDDGGRFRLGIQLGAVGVLTVAVLST